MNGKRILIIEDDENITRLEMDYLEVNGFDVDFATNGTRGLDMALSGKYNLILLDIMLPGMNGLDICRHIREVSNVPILLVSAKGDDVAKIKGLGFGADDYIVKPFSPSELVARVIAHINRYERLTTMEPEPTGHIQVGELKIDKDARRATYENVELALTNKEFDLLATLAESPDTVFGKEELLHKIWNYDSMGDTSTVVVHINRVREKLFSVDPNSEYVNTVWGKGYRFNK